MCVYSLVVDHYSDKWQDYVNKPVPQPFVTVPVPTYQFPTAEEIAEFRKLLDRAREYDKRNSEPDCELEAKKERIRKLAAELGVEVGFV